LRGGKFMDVLLRCHAVAGNWSVIEWFSFRVR
jgi:hypothetical protein